MFINFLKSLNSIPEIYRISFIRNFIWFYADSYFKLSKSES